MNKKWMAMMAMAVVAAPLWAQTPKPPPRAQKAAPVLTQRPDREITRVRVPYPPGASRSYLGVDVADITADRVAPLKLKEERGVEITMVDQDAPAGKAGLKEHDVILEYNGTRVEGEEELRRLIRETPAGRTVTLGISRDGQPMQIKVTLGDRSKLWAENHVYAFQPRIEVPEIPDVEIPAFDIVMRSYSPSTGIMIDNLTPQLGQYFGVANGQGVLVRSVEKGSAAEAAGLRAGDVIVKVDEEKIGDRTDWRRALRNRKGGKVNITVVRDKKEQVLTLTLPERREQGELQGFAFPNMEWDWDFDQFDDHQQEELQELKKELPKMKEEMKKMRETLTKEAEMQAKLSSKEFQEQQKELQKQQVKLRREMEKSRRKAARELAVQEEI